MLSPRLQAPANGQEAMERLEKGTLQMKVAKDLRRRPLRGKSRILSDLQKQMEDKRKQELHEEHRRREEAHAQERAATEATRARLRAEALSRMRHARPNTRRGGLSPRPQYGPPGLLLPRETKRDGSAWALQPSRQPTGPGCFVGSLSHCCSPRCPVGCRAPLSRCL